MEPFLVPDHIMRISRDSEQRDYTARAHLHLTSLVARMSDGRPPEAVRAFVVKFFPFQHFSTDSFKPLPSYYDCNIYFEGTLEPSTTITYYISAVKSFWHHS